MSTRDGSAVDAGVPILMYHAVEVSPTPATYALSVSPEAFATQLAVLEEGGFTPMTTAELAGWWREDRPLPPRPVALTFDDGYAGTHEHALPLLVEHGFTATVFASTGWLRGKYDNHRAPGRMLEWEQLRELDDAGVEVGGHSHSHPELDQLDDAGLREELRRCRDLLALELGRSPRSFAYPYGYATRRVREAVRAAGFRQSLAVGNALADRRRQGPYSLRRLTVRRSTSDEDFARLVHGRSLGSLYAMDRLLTDGYAVVRGVRRGARRVRHPRE